jgi:hypothetical protein
VRRLHERFLRLPYRRRFDLTVGGVVVVIVAALAVGILRARHPTVASVAAHVNAAARAGQLPKLSDAEIQALADAQAQTSRKRGWMSEDVSAAPTTVTLRAPGERNLRVGYSDGWIGLSDVHHWGSADDVQDAISALDERRSVVAGGPGEAIVGGCCEGSEARVTVALRREAPTAGAGSTSRWPWVGEVDLDLTTGTLVFTSTGGTAAVVHVPEGRYRLRLSSAGAVEGEQDKDAYRVELWPRTANTALRVLRPTPAA